MKRIPVRWLGAFATAAGVGWFSTQPPTPLDTAALQGQGAGSRTERAASDPPTHFAGAWLDEWFLGSPARSLIQYSRIGRNNRYDARSRQLALARQSQVAVARAEPDRIRNIDRDLRRVRRRRDGQGPTARTVEFLRIASNRARSSTVKDGPDPTLVNPWNTMTNEQLTWIERAPWAMGRSMWLAPGTTGRRIAARPSPARRSAREPVATALALPQPGANASRGLLQRRGILISQHVLAGRVSVARVLTQDLLSRSGSAERRRIARPATSWPEEPDSLRKLLTRIAMRAIAQSERPGLLPIERSITRAVGTRIRSELESNDLQATTAWIDLLPYRLAPATRR